MRHRWQACRYAPEHVEGYCAPSLSLLARYWDDTWEDLQDAAQTLLQDAVKRILTLTLTLV